MSIEGQAEMLIECGYDVMIHGRADESCDNAGTSKWVIEIDRYPIAVTTQREGGMEAALDYAIEHFFEVYVQENPTWAIDNRA